MRNLYHVVNALPPVANAFGGTVVTTPINLKNWAHVSFLVLGGSGAVGTAKITVEACSDTTPTSTSAIPFYYQECVSGDTFGQIQKTADNTGFTTSASNNKIYKIEVDNEMLALSGYNYVRVKSVEQTVGAITGGIVAILREGRFESEVNDSVLV